MKLVTRPLGWVNPRAGFNNYDLEKYFDLYGAIFRLMIDPI
jgi:hypothetical protein